ncbi:MAG: DUF4143 domain-containing protein [Candidatus Methanoplasma sp.]|nr:DUF4143 domain-containing protein [Candidatus Methanoplasma sp.]
MDLYLETFGAVLLKGPRWCGKTTTAMNHAKSVIKMQSVGKSQENLAAARSQPSMILRGEKPRLIDEWQVVPSIWDAIRTDVDETGRAGSYILTGSRDLFGEGYMHSGAGRIGVLFMRTMSLFESGDSNGSVSLGGMFSGSGDSGWKPSPLSMDDIAYCLCRGGWPDNMGLDYRRCALKIRSYMDLTYASDDVSLGKYIKDSSAARDIVRSYSRNISSTASMKTILDDVLKEDISMPESRFYDYVGALKGAYIIDDVPAWNPSVRSRTAMRASPKRDLADPSIAALYLGVTPDSFAGDLKTFGLLFESMCLRDLKVYAQGLGGKMSYYRDRYGLEADAVITLDDGRYGLVEVKLWEDGVREGADNLLALEGLLRDAGFRPPSFKMVVTAGGIAYSRPDGVSVVPIGCLRN